MPTERRAHKIPVLIKVLTTCFLCVVVPVYWAEVGPKNFLWFSDIALIAITVALWLESRFLASMMAVGGLIPELVWNADFFFRLVAGSHLFDLGATGYMFDPQRPWIIRGLSLALHMYLLIIFIWLAYRLGYHPKAWIAQTVLAWVVLPLSYWLTEPPDNINFVFGLGAEPQQWVAAPVYVVILMILIPLIIYIPSHLLLNRFFGRGRPKTERSKAGNNGG